VLAFGIDVLLAATLFAVGGAVVEFLLSSLLGKDVRLSDAPIVSAIALAVWLLVYFAYPVAVGGRTVGMAIVGLEVVTSDGRHVGAGRATIRTMLIPLSLVLLGIGILTILIDRRRRALHDLIAGTAVVYSWNARAARLRFLATRGTDERSAPR
jgi:uncharacterized RDD family membrane protein YckC